MIQPRPKAHPCTASRRHSHSHLRHNSSGSTISHSGECIPLDPAARTKPPRSRMTSLHYRHARKGKEPNYYQHHGGDSAMDGEPAPPSMDSSNFDILEWHPAYQSCQRFFIDHAQFEPATQAVCALINIRLPFQWLDTPVTSSGTPPSTSRGPQTSSNFDFNAFARQQREGGSGRSPYGQPPSNSPITFVSLVPYIRRLVVTGFDKPAILHGFFGDEYVKGIMPHIECERRNYLFAAKHGGWRSCKKQYDNGSGGGGDETVPFMKPLDEATAGELTAAEKAWSRWLAMEDWMVGPRAPGDEEVLRVHSHRPGYPHGRDGGGMPGGI